jgi:ethanolamine utilization protein EutQ (cupin superfamily)
MSTTTTKSTRFLSKTNYRNNSYKHNNNNNIFDQIGKDAEKKLDSSPDETRTFENGKIELVNLGDVVIGRAIFESGWSWEKSVKPLVKTESCQAPHTMYVVSGRMKVRMDVGIEAETGPGDTAVIPPGHNAWVVGNESYIAIDFTGAKD